MQVDLIGWVEDWTSRCPPDAVLLHPAVKEGFGNVLIESACAGIPAVAVSNALGVADAVVPGVTGSLALDASVESLAEAVLDAQAVTFEGADAWLNRFSPERSTDLLLATLQRTVQGR